MKQTDSIRTVNEDAPSAGILVIGDEILSGKVKDENSPYLCGELHFLGVKVCRVSIIPDEYAVIAEHARDFSERFTWVFTSGGVGPTHDDVTISAIASGFNVGTVESPELLKVIRGYYGERFQEAHRRMARIPEGASLLELSAMRSPQVTFHNIFFFPGVPELLRSRFSALKEHFRSGEIFLRQIFMNADEGHVARALDATHECFPDLMLGSYPALWRKDYSLKLTLEARREAYLEEAFRYLTARLPEVDIIRVE